MLVRSGALLWRFVAPSETGSERNRRRFFGTKIILYLAALSGRDPFDAALRPGLSPGDRVWEATFWRNVRVV